MARQREKRKTGGYGKLGSKEILTGREVETWDRVFVGGCQVIEIEAAKESDFAACFAKSAQLVLGLEDVVLSG